MKREEVKEIFPNATEDDIDRLLNKVRDELNPLKRDLKETTEKMDEYHTALEEAQVQALDFKTRYDEAQAKIEEGMTAEERIAAREQAADAREREYNMRLNGLEARQIFVESTFIDSADIDALVEQVTSDSLESTKSKAQIIVDMLAKQRDSVEAATRDALLKANPKPEGKGGEGAIPTTVSDFLKLPYSEQVALKEANPGLLAQLKK